MTENAPIRSFVRRDSRITRAQREALEYTWDTYALPDCTSSAELAAAFGRRASCTLEIGSGDGSCIIELARNRASENFVAVEVYRPGLGRLLNLAEAAALKNLRVSNQDVCEMLAPFVKEAFDQVMVFFPDPWPKKRHHKRRLLQRKFFELLALRLHRHGRLFIATDSESYALSINETIADSPGWINLSGPGRVAPRVTFRPVTKFERKAKAAGSAVHEFILARA